MEKLKLIWTQYKKYFLITSGVIVLIISLVFYLINLKQSKEKNNEKNISKELVEKVSEENTQVEIVPETFYVDIKGYVKNPGVYEVTEGTIVNDLIKLAGGITKKGTTKNINLSRSLSDSMVIVIKSEKDLEKKDEIEECICEEVEITECIQNTDSSIITSSSDANTNSNISNSQSETTPTTKISINTATLQELMTLPGVGESKAQGIIDYRNTNGSFNTIEDIKNVSGIGESLFAKIKENITT